MKITRVPVEARAAVQARLRRDLADLDYRRALLALRARGYTQLQIANWVGVTQPTVLSSLKTATKVTPPQAGFSGATPTEICQRYAAGYIDHAQLVSELARYPYVAGGQTDGYDSLMVDPPGAWAEVAEAIQIGLIDDDAYEEAFDRRHGSRH